MKKKLNYWQVHLNKKPKNLNRRKKKYISTIGIKLALHQASMAAKIEMIQQQPFKEYKERAKAIICLIDESCNKIVKMCEEEELNRFRVTRKYRRKQKQK